MPSPVEALPWGSRSMMRTSSPTAASAVPRLIAVVVLPTPPFWLAMASTRGGRGGSGRLTTAGGICSGETVMSVIGFRPRYGRGSIRRCPRESGFRMMRQFTRRQRPHDHDSRLRIRTARDKIVRHVPIFRGFGQFHSYILTFGEEPDRPVVHEYKAFIKQVFQARDSARRDRVGRALETIHEFIDSGCMNCDRGAGDS